MLAGPLRGSEPEPVLVMTPGYRTRPGRSAESTWARLVVLGCLVWLVVILPVLACALGWALA